MSATAGVGSDLQSDAELIAAARTRDAAAFGALYERHAGAALVVARQHTDSAADADDVVADAFTAVWGALERGHGPTEAFRAYLFTVVRRVASARRDAGRRTQPTDDVAVLEAGALPAADAAEPALAGLERSLVARAFATLPERWQAVLWHSEVEGLQPAQIAPLLGLTANSTAALAYRAREGLRQAYLQQHLNEPLDDGCRAVSGKLGSYVRRGLGARDTRAVEAHLDECGRCRGLVLELGDVSHGMRGVVAPLVLGLAGLGALGHVLPVGGGLAAGLASLTAGAAGSGAAGGGAAGGGGAAATGTGAGASAGGAAGGAGGAAAGGAAAGELAGTGAAVGGTGAAMGTGVAGAAGAGTAAVGALSGAGVAGIGGVLAGAGGLLAAVPTALVAGIAVVAVGAAGVVGVTRVLSSDASDRPAASAAVDPAAGGDDAGAGGGSSDGAAGGTVASGVTPTPDPTPSPTSTDPAALPNLGGGSTAVLPRSSGSGMSGTSGTGTGTGTSGTTTTGTGSGGGTGSGSGTGTDPTPPVVQPTPALLSVQGPGTFELTAGATGALAVDVANTGDSSASSLVADVNLPAGVVLDGVDTGALSAVTGRFAPLTSTGWLCATVDGGVRCTLDQLPGHMQVRLTLTVRVPETYSAADGAVGWTLRGTGLQTVSSSTPLHVGPSPARLVAGGSVADVQVTVGRTAQVAVPVQNAGGTATSAAAPAVVDVSLPAGVAYASSDGPWACTSTAGAGGASSVRCTDPALAARGSATLSLGLTGTAPGTGTVSMTLGPAAGRTPAVMTFGITVVAAPDPPATGPVLHLAAGEPRAVMTGGTGTVELTVGVGDPTSSARQLDASWVAATVVLPSGVHWTDGPVTVGHGLCISTENRRVVTCLLGHVAAGTSARIVLPVAGRTAIGEDVSVTLTAVGATTVTVTRPIVAG